MKRSDEEQARARSLAFNTEASRAGLFAAALDIGDLMKEQNIPEGEAALVTGAIEFAVQFYMAVMLGAGHSKQAARKSLEEKVRFFANKHGNPELQREAVAS